jgi:Carboxypeptidase regulatory-like domain
VLVWRGEIGEFGQQVDGRHRRRPLVHDGLRLGQCRFEIARVRVELAGALFELLSRYQAPHAQVDEPLPLGGALCQFVLDFAHVPSKTVRITAPFGNWDAAAPDSGQASPESPAPINLSRSRRMIIQRYLRRRFRPTPVVMIPSESIIPGNTRMISIRLFVAIGVTLFGWPIASWPAVYGSVGGIVTDQSGSVVPGSKLTLNNKAQGIPYKTSTDAKGAYSFPSIPVGHYDLAVESAGFETQHRNGLVVDLNSVLHVDFVLQVAGKQETVTVTEANPVAVETASTQLGGVVTGRSMTGVALNGRSFTDLLALQPGIVPVSTQQPDSSARSSPTPL